MLRIHDIHCHILFGVDDGSKDREQSLRMIDIAYQEGIRAIILTPHYNRRYFDNSIEDVTKVYEDLCQEAGAKYPDMKLYLGNEIYYTEHTLEKLESKEILTMAGGSYILVEFSNYVELTKLNHAVTKLVQYGYKPVIAHVERYECLMKKPDYIETLTEMGAYIQVNAGSVIGKSGSKAKKMVRRLLKEQQVHFVATDAHRDDSRAPHISKCKNYIEKKYGYEYMEELFVHNPECIINNEYI